MPYMMSSVAYALVTAGDAENVAEELREAAGWHPDALELVNNIIALHECAYGDKEPSEEATKSIDAVAQKCADLLARLQRIDMRPPRGISLRRLLEWVGPLVAVMFSLIRSIFVFVVVMIPFAGWLMIICTLGW